MRLVFMGFDTFYPLIWSKLEVSLRPFPLRLSLPLTRQDTLRMGLFEFGREDEKYSLNQYEKLFWV